LLVSGLEELSTNNIIEIDRSLRNLVKIFGAQKTPPKLILSDEINLPKNTDIVSNDALKLV